jgi:integrase
MRCNEIAWEAGYIGVRRTIDRFGERAPKTKSSIRDIPIMDTFRVALIDQYGRRKADGAYLFCRDDGTPWTPDYTNENGWSKAFGVLDREMAGIARRVPYTTRHSFVSNAIDAGEALEWVRETVGHSTSKITMDVYNHIVKRKDRQDGNKLSATVAAL